MSTRISKSAMELGKQLVAITQEFISELEGERAHRVVSLDSSLMKDLGIDNHLVEIGGELRGAGKNSDDEAWRVGIDEPLIESRELKAVVELPNMAMATSGNYRNFYIRDGIKYAHTIDPRTGYPVEHSLLSATVFALDCMTADAWATAFMVHGLDSAKILVESMPQLDVFFIFSDSTGSLSTYATAGVNVIKVID